MKNARKTLIKVIIALSTVLCLLIGMTNFLENKEQNNNTLGLREDIPENLPQKDTVEQPLGGESQGNSEMKVGNKDTSNLEGNLVLDETSNQETVETPQNTEPQPEDTEPNGTQVAEFEPSATEPADDEGQSNSETPETVPAETESEITSNDNNVTPDDEL